MALFLVVLMSINSFAAIVSDNDGSAFVTKAEFEAMKRDFADQVTNYNESIDAKIDGAIAAYLAGIKLKKRTMYKVEMSDADEILCVNGVLPEVWKMPNVDMSFGIGFAGNSANGNWFEGWWSLAGLKYKRSDGDHQVRNVIKAGNEKENADPYPEKVVWLGQSIDYIDSISAVKIGQAYSAYGGASDAPNYLQSMGVAGNNMSIIKVMDIATGNKTGVDVNDLWKARMWWKRSSGVTGYQIGVDNWIISNVSSSANLKIIDNEQYTNKNILNWKTATWSQLSDPNWANTLGENRYYTQDEFIKNSDIEKSGAYGGSEYNDDYIMTPGSWSRRDYNPASLTSGSIILSPLYNKQFTDWWSGSSGATSDDSIVSVGVLDNDYTSQNILQWEGDKTLVRDDSIKIEALNLLQGSVIGYAKQEETFGWKPVITGRYYDTATSTYKPINKWRVKLARAPFVTKDQLEDEKNVLKNKGQTESYLETDDTGKCSYDVEIEKNSVIYCKWWPADETICNNYYWEGKLDLTQCGTYIIAT